MNGKSKCKILKQIRQKIADENDIAYVTSECQYQGACSGTCPKCEAEVRYLEQELEKRLRLGKAVAVAGIAATLVVSSAGFLSACAATAGDPMPPPNYTEPVDGEMLPAGVPAIQPTDPTDTQPSVPELMGEVAIED